MRLENRPEDVRVAINSGKGACFYRSPSLNVQLLYSQILKELLIFNILEAFLYQKQLSIVNLALDNFSSVASIRRKYRAINSYFSEMGIEIKNGRIWGDERNIRWFYAKFYWKVFKGCEWPFRTVQRQELLYLLEGVQKELNFEIVPEVKEEFLFRMAINAMRFYKGYRVPNDKEIEKYATHTPDYERFVQVLGNHFPSEVKKQNEENRAEMQFRFLLFSALPLLEKEENFSATMYEAHKEGQTLMYQMTQDWLLLYEKMFQTTIYGLKRRKLEIKLLRIHSYSYLYKKGAPLFFKKDCSKNIQTLHPQFFQKMSDIYAQLDRIYPEITQNRTYLIENYILLAMKNFDIDVWKPAIHVAMSLSKGSIYESLAKIRLETYFKGKHKLHFVSYSQSKDLWITDLPNILILREEQVVSVNPPLMPRDIFNIEASLDELYSNYDVIF